MAKHPAIHSAAAPSKHARLCVYSDPGVGKTRLVGTSAQVGRTLVIRPPTDHTDAMLTSDKARSMRPCWTTGTA